MQHRKFNFQKHMLESGVTVLVTSAEWIREKRQAVARQERFITGVIPREIRKVTRRPMGQEPLTVEIPVKSDLIWHSRLKQLRTLCGLVWNVVRSITYYRHLPKGAVVNRYCPILQCGGFQIIYIKHICSFFD